MVLRYDQGLPGCAGAPANEDKARLNMPVNQAGEAAGMARTGQKGCGGYEKPEGCACKATRNHIW